MTIVLDDRIYPWMYQVSLGRHRCDQIHAALNMSFTTEPYIEDRYTAVGHQEGLCTAWEQTSGSDEWFDIRFNEDGFEGYFMYSHLDTVDFAISERSTPEEINHFFTTLLRVNREPSLVEGSMSPDLKAQLQADWDGSETVFRSRDEQDEAEDVIHVAQKQVEAFFDAKLRTKISSTGTLTGTIKIVQP